MELPQLEKMCPHCNGARGDNDPEEGWLDCSFCDGAGYVPTEEGVKLRRFIIHHFRAGLRTN